MWLRWKELRRKDRSNHDRGYKAQKYKANEQVLET
jgi:hypothetical protein